MGHPRLTRMEPSVDPQQLAQAWAFVVQVFDDHHRTLSPAAAASFQAVGQQKLGIIEKALTPLITPPPKKARKRVVQSAPGESRA